MHDWPMEEALSCTNLERIPNIFTVPGSIMSFKSRDSQRFTSHLMNEMV